MDLATKRIAAFVPQAFAKPSLVFIIYRFYFTLVPQVTNFCTPHQPSFHRVDQVRLRPRYVNDDAPVLKARAECRFTWTALPLSPRTDYSYLFISPHLRSGCLEDYFACLMFSTTIYKASLKISQQRERQVDKEK